MALINCPECNMEVSDKADTCPKCGYGIVKHFQDLESERLAEERKVQVEQQKVEREQREVLEYQQRLEQIKMPLKPNFIKYALLFLVVFGFFILMMARFTDSGNDMSGTSLVAGLIVCTPFIIILIAIVGTYNASLNNYESATRNFEAYKINQIQKQDSNKAEYNRQLQEKMSKMVKCPTCSSYNTKAISTTSRVVSVGMVGLASSKIGKTMECKNCGYKW